MKIKARITARAPKPQESVERLQAQFADWPDYVAVGNITLVSKYSNGLHWVAAVTMEKELT